MVVLLWSISDFDQNVFYFKDKWNVINVKIYLRCWDLEYCRPSNLSVLSKYHDQLPRCQRRMEELTDITTNPDPLKSSEISWNLFIQQIDFGTDYGVCFFDVRRWKPLSPFGYLDSKLSFISICIFQIEHNIPLKSFKLSHFSKRYVRSLFALLWKSAFLNRIRISEMPFH